MAQRLQEEAAAYLQKHKIYELLGNLTAQLIFTKPDDPKEYMIKYLEKLIKIRDTAKETDDYPSMFDEKNLKSMFRMLDPCDVGFISHEQYLEAMKSLGAVKFTENPIGAETNEISLQTFLDEAKTGIENALETFDTPADEQE